MAGGRAGSTALRLRSGSRWWLRTVVAEYPRTGSNSVFGVVRDYETKEPLSGAVVKLYNSNFRLCASMTTDATGQYDFSWLSSDMYFLVASRPAYYPIETNWIPLSMWDHRQVDLELVHNRSLMIEDFTLPSSWPVGQLGEITWTLVNPGTAPAVEIVTDLELPWWLKIIPESVQVTGRAGNVGSEEMQGLSHNQLRLSLSHLGPGERVKISLLAHPLPGYRHVPGTAKVSAWGRAAGESVQAPSVEKAVSPHWGDLGPMAPENRLWITSQWQEPRAMWQGGLLLDYPQAGGTYLGKPVPVYPTRW